jgi:hypothetical protein
MRFLQKKACVSPGGADLPGPALFFPSVISGGSENSAKKSKKLLTRVGRRDLFEGFPQMRSLDL